jgi:hypothetical protein
MAGALTGQRDIVNEFYVEILARHGGAPADR